MRAGAGEAEAAGHGRGEVGARARELLARGRHRRMRRGDDLELRGRHLELEARVAAEPGDHLGGVRREVERLAVEQHQLLLEADGDRAGLVERGPQLGGRGQRIAHGPGG